ncbi:MAG: Asp-tRNA(Asn)/Glu-tRNA(Gln) amidotransferase subunit GatC [Anaerolineaceae bacterium]|nr:Asp-tRNA(Asn)/Glu-tRNA(Gln) amidotransferase subunit GatC [Anaerolineaceae bacterium]
MKLTRTEVEHIAELARLKLSEFEIDQYSQQLSDILDYAARLQELDTSDIPPMSSSLTTLGVLRSDQSEIGLKLHDLENNAPLFKNKQFRVPPVLDTSNETE